MSDEAIRELHRLMETRDYGDPDDVVDALGLVLLSNPTNVNKETISGLLAALRSDMRAAKEDREGEEWKGGAA